MAIRPDLAAADLPPSARVVELLTLVDADGLLDQVPPSVADGFDAVSSFLSRTAPYYTDARRQPLELPYGMVTDVMGAIRTPARFLQDTPAERWETLSARLQPVVDLMKPQDNMTIILQIFRLFGTQRTWRAKLEALRTEVLGVPDMLPNVKFILRRFLFQMGLYNALQPPLSAQFTFTTDFALSEDDIAENDVYNNPADEDGSVAFLTVCCQEERDQLEAALGSVEASDIFNPTQADYRSFYQAPSLLAACNAFRMRLRRLQRDVHMVRTTWDDEAWAAVQEDRRTLRQLEDTHLRGAVRASLPESVGTALDRLAGAVVLATRDVSVFHFPANPLVHSTETDTDLAGWHTGSLEDLLHVCGRVGVVIASSSALRPAARRNAQEAWQLLGAATMCVHVWALFRAELLGRPSNDLIRVLLAKLKPASELITSDPPEIEKLLRRDPVVFQLGRATLDDVNRAVALVDDAIKWVEGMYDKPYLRLMQEALDGVEVVLTRAQQVLEREQRRRVSTVDLPERRLRAAWAGAVIRAGIARRAGLVPAGSAGQPRIPKRLRIADAERGGRRKANGVLKLMFTAP